MVEKFCKGLRVMPVIKKYPDLWMAMTLDGFGSHFDPGILEIFAKYKILLAKEKGDSSRFCQPYDQFVAKEDKRHLHSLMQGYQLNAPMVSQF